MKNYQEREFSRTAVRPKGGVHDCMDAGGRATQEQLPREVHHEKLSGKRIFTHAVRPKGDIQGSMS